MCLIFIKKDVFDTALSHSPDASFLEEEEE